MNPALWAVLGGVAVLLLVLLAAGLAMLVVGRGDARRAEALAAARADVDTLRDRVDELTTELHRARVTAPVASTGTELVITSAGRQDPVVAPSHRPQVPEGAVLSVTLGEPLVKVAAWSYGLRRALSAESRNRIAFQVRREIKRARKERRRAARRSRVAPAHEGESAA